MRSILAMLGALVVVTLNACAGPVPDAAGSPRPTPTANDSAPTDAFAEPSEAAPPTESRASAIELLDCDGPISTVGAVGEEVALQVAGGSGPDEALLSFLESSPWVIPRAGYEPIGRSGDRHAYGFTVGAEVKVVVVVSQRYARPDAAYIADELRTCPSGEFGAGAGFGDGRRAWTHLETDHVIHDIEGPQHCDWQSARLMHLQHPDGSIDRQYVRDPNGVLPADPLLTTYAGSVDLPPDATDSGYRSPEGFELWFSKADLAAFIVTPDGVERWPRASDPIGCM